MSNKENVARVLSIVGVLAVPVAAAAAQQQPPGPGQPGQRPPTGSQPARDKPAQTQDAPPPPAGRITGRVIASDNGRPVKRARVFVTAVELPGGRGMLTD